MALKIYGTFTATGASDTIELYGDFNVQVTGIAGGSVVALERKLPGETAFAAVDSLTADTSQRGFEPEFGTVYRLNCTAFGTGSVAYRLSKSA